MGQLEARAPALGGIGCRGLHWRVSLKTLQNWRFIGGGPPYLKINSRKTVYDTADLGPVARRAQVHVDRTQTIRRGTR
jgi:hypothetical protein